MRSHANYLDSVTERQVREALVEGIEFLRERSRGQVTFEYKVRRNVDPNMDEPARADGLARLGALEQGRAFDAGLGEVPAVAVGLMAFVTVRPSAATRPSKTVQKPPSIIVLTLSR